MTFSAAKESFGSLSAETTAKVIAATADIALVIDGNAVIVDAAIARPDLKSDLANASYWAGQSLTDVVTESSRPKVKSLMDDAAGGAPPKWRQLAHPSNHGSEIPILYSAIRIKKNRMLAVGRDMRVVADLQQQLIDTQTSMERDYSRLRHAETRYRVLFQTTSEPVLVVDAATEHVVEENPAAVRLFGPSAGRTIGRNAPRGLDAASTQALAALASIIRDGRPLDDFRVRMSSSETELTVAVLPFRQGTELLLLLRFVPEGLGAALPAATSGNAKLIEFFRRSTDGCVVVDQYGRIKSANASFVQMAQLVNEKQAYGELLERWLGRSNVDVSVMIANLRRQENVTLFSTVMRGEYGAASEIEVSGFALDHEGHQNFGLSIRDVGRRLGDLAQGQRQLPHTVEQLKELIGRMSLKEMVRESTDMIEKLCIEAALDLTDDNRASAAEMLGLSRQSLYVKLRRYGIADDDAGVERESS